MGWRIAVSLFVVGLSLICIITSKEIFPFSHYPMYSVRYTPLYLHITQVMAVDSNGAEVNMPEKAMWPMGTVNLNRSMLVHKRLCKENKEKNCLNKIAKAIYKNYLEVVKFGRLENKFSKIRIYDYKWLTGSFSKKEHKNNIAPPPDKKTLIAEYP